MNRIFRTVWNRALRQIVVASELCRSRGEAGRSVDARSANTSGTARMLRLTAGVLLSLAGLTAAQAHTITIGYANSGNNALTFWYGTYHNTAFTEGSLHLVGPGIDVTNPFVNYTQTRPSGLIDGDTNFWSDGTSLVGYATYSGPVLTWQGMEFTGLIPGTYTFTYVPIAVPTQDWQPINNVILTSSVTVITADLNVSAPRIGPNVVVDENWVRESLNPGDPLIFTGGTLQPTATTTLDQVVSVAKDGGTIDTGLGKDLTLTGDMDGRGLLTKTGDGTLFIEGNNASVGGLAINGGVVSVNSDSALGDPSAQLSLDGGTLNTTGDINNSRDITLNADGGTFDTDAGTTLTNNGTISGAGSLTKDGSGTLVLTGTNTYDGGTTVNAGTLQSDTESLRGDITNNATVDFSQPNDGTYAGEMSGTGNLVKEGSGTLVLTGTNTYTGDTTITNGATLTLAGDGSIADSRNVRTEGTLDVSGHNGDVEVTSLSGSGTVNLGSNGLNLTDAAGTFAGSIGGAGGVTVTGGTEVLTGSNTYSGGTALNGGSLHVASDANLGDASGNLMFNGGDLTVTQSLSTNRDMQISSGNASITTLGGVTLTADGDLSGTGGLAKHGSGTLVVRGSNSYSGGTLVDGGSIVIDSGSSLGTGGLRLDGGNLHSVASLDYAQTVVVSGASSVTVDAGTTTLFSGQILGSGASGCFIKNGAGVLSMTGLARLDSGTCVQEGTLRANGNLISQVWVDAPGTLRGIGNIQGDIDVKGALAAGNSPGTLTVNGSVTMHADSTFEVDIDGHGTGTGAGNYSRLLVLGANHTFSASGTLLPVLRGISGDASNTFVPVIGDRFMIVDAEGGVIGRFDSLTQPTAGLSGSERFLAFYTADGHGIELRVTPTSYQSVVTAAGGNANTQSAGMAVDTMLSASDAGVASTEQQTLLQRMAALSSEQIASVAHALSGEIHAREAAAARDRFLTLAGEVGDHLAADGVAGENGRHDNLLWANLGRDGSRFSSDSHADGFKTSENRTTLGLDAYRGGAALLGLGITHVQTQLLDNGGAGDIRGEAMFVYGQAQAGGVLLDGVASRSNDRWTTKRADAFATDSELAARADGHTTMASFTTSLPMTAAQVSITPFARAAWQRVERDGFSENGDPAERLILDHYEATGTRLLAGLNVGSKTIAPLNAPVTYRVSAAVGHDFGGLTNSSVDAQLDGVGLRVQAPQSGRSFVQLDLNGTLRLSKTAYVYGGVTSETGKGHSSYAATTGIRLAL